MAEAYLWDRQPAESGRAFAAFVVYRDLGLDRSLDKAYARANGLQPGDKRVPGRWQAWSKQYQWPERAAAYDAMLRTREAAQREAAQAAEAATWAKRRAEEAEREWEFAQRLIEKARVMLSFPLDERTLEDGKIVVKPVRWALRDAATLIDTAAKLARLAAGMETGRQTLQGPNGEPLFAPADVLTALTQLQEARTGDAHH